MKRSGKNIVGLAIVGLALASHPASGQGDSVAVRIAAGDPSYSCVLRSDDRDLFSFVGRDVMEMSLSKSNSSIAITFVNESASDPWPDAAKEAIEYASTIWEGILSSQIVIRIQANWKDLGSCTGSQFALASAGPQYIYQGFRNAPKSDTWYPDALADALGAVDRRPGDFDIVAQFNRSCGPAGSGIWYTGTDARPPSGRIDMVSVALHEFAHGLGIFGSANVDDGKTSNGSECNGTDGVGCVGTGSSNDPMTYDQFVEDGNGLRLLELSNPSAVLGTALEGGRAGGIYFSGPEVNAAGFNRARLYAPSTFNAGASYAHVDESTFNRTPEALMTPFLGRAEAIHLPGALACGMLADIGWRVNDGCSQSTTSITEDETLPREMTVEALYPNPAADVVSLGLTLAVDQQTDVELVDPLGRIVGRPFSGVLASGRPHLLQIPVSHLAPGAYVIVVKSGGTQTSRLLVVNR